MNCKIYAKYFHNLEIISERDPFFKGLNAKIISFTFKDRKWCPKKLLITFNSDEEDMSLKIQPKKVKKSKKRKRAASEKEESEDEFEKVIFNVKNVPLLRYDNAELYLAYKIISN